MTYWAKRQAKIQEELSKQSQRKIDRQLTKYYQQAARNVMAEFESVYDKILQQQADGKQITPALLYKLDSYWNMLGQTRAELQKLGEKQVALLTKEFETNFFEIYYSIAPEGMTAFNTIDAAGARQLINAVWLADNKTFSQRVWNNVEKLTETLNEELVAIVATGKRTTQLKDKLQERFAVSYYQANTLVRTELAHVQTVAAKQRYEDYGLRYYEILGNDDDTCGQKEPDCHKLDGKRFLYSEMVIGQNAPPFHPNCRCSIIPVVE
jgi:SPP1 gp7 family putative phage head morphogenesis protein